MTGQSKKVLVHLDMGGNEVKNFVVDKYASDPSTGVEGQMIYNTNDGQIKVRVNNLWVPLASGGAMPTPSDTTPKMDGTAVKGSENAYARGDHVHPTDTSRQAAITSSAKLSSDLVDDTNEKHKFITDAERTSWNGKQNQLTAGVGIEISTNNVISADTAFHAQVFTTLPTASDAYKNTVGLILKTGSTTQYLTYMCTTENDGVTWSWKQIGTTDMDLSDYYTKAQTNGLLDGKQPVGDYATNTALTQGLAGKVDTTRKVNGHALSADVTVSKSDVGLGSVVNAGRDTTVTYNSNNYITSGAVYDALPKESSLTISTTKWAYNSTLDCYYVTVEHGLGALPKSVELYDALNIKVITVMGVTTNDITVFANIRPNTQYTLRVIS